MTAAGVTGKGSRGAWRLVSLVALIAGLVAVPLAPAEAVQRPETLYSERPVGVGAVEPGFPVDHVGVVFDLPDHAAAHDDQGDPHEGVDVQVRFRHSGHWGAWQRVGEDGAQQAGSWTGALVAGDDADAYQVRGVPPSAGNARAAAINTTDGEMRTVGYRPAGSAHAVTPCKSRLDWGADETLRTSNRSYGTVQLLTVHHTATQNDDPEPDARVRAIYKYHTTTNGWDDIGYQALISEDGTVYEGRWSGSDSPSCLTGGGTGWEFGHYGTAVDAQMVTGAHTGGYNTGNFGVSLLGTFTDTVAPKPAAREALVAYLAELADRHGIDPQSPVDYDNGTNSGTFDAISGHRDFKATECPGGSLYADLPALRADVAAAMASPAEPVVTITSPTDGDSYTVSETVAGAGATVSFAATATDDTTASTALAWTWTDETDAEMSQTVSTAASFDATLEVGTYAYKATATDADGLTGSDAITVTVASADSTSSAVDDVPSAEQTVSGTVSGSYLDTQADGGAAEAITEVESGGRPADRYSLLEHVWAVPVTGGSSVTLFVDAAATASSDADGFSFAYSTDGGASYSAPVLTVPAGADGVYSASLPATLSGTVQLRVTDTDRARGSRNLDTLTVDHLYVRSESGTASTPAAPTGLTATASSATTVDLAWTDAAEDEHGYELERSDDAGGNWTRVADLGADTVAFSDSGLAGQTAYRYRLRAYNSAGPSSWAETTVETPAASDITLTASGRKVQGSHVVDLAWTGATDVVVLRDGAQVDAITGDSYSDETGGKGTGSYVHQVCTSDREVCSTEVTTSIS